MPHVICFWHVAGVEDVANPHDSRFRMAPEMLRPHVIWTCSYVPGPWNSGRPPRTTLVLQKLTFQPTGLRDRRSQPHSVGDVLHVPELEKVMTIHRLGRVHTFYRTKNVTTPCSIMGFEMFYTFQKLRRRRQEHDSKANETPRPGRAQGLWREHDAGPARPESDSFALPHDHTHMRAGLRCTRSSQPIQERAVSTSEPLWCSPWE